MAKRRLFRGSYSIDALPFEVSYHGSWHCIDHVSIKGGSIYVDFIYHGSKIEEKIHGDNLRLRSRKACIFDCRCFLRPGIDVCVISTNQNASTSVEELLPVLHDAKIISIKRKPHEYRCDCLFSVSFYGSKTLLKGSESKLEGSIEEVTIDNIAILQKLRSEPLEDGYRHWNSSEDCVSIHKSKLLSGLFGSEVSWLLVISILKRMDFDIRTIENKIVYCILNGDLGFSGMADTQLVHDYDLLASENEQNKNQDTFSAGSEKKIAIVFQRSDGNSKPKTESYVPVIPKLMTIPCSSTKIVPVGDMTENDLDNEMLYHLMDLRRSKRVKLVPDHFVSYTCLSRPVRSVAYEKSKQEQQEKLCSTTSSSMPTANSSSHIQELYPDNLQCTSPLLREGDPCIMSQGNHCKNINAKSSKLGESSSTPAVLPRKNISDRKNTESQSQHIPDVAEIRKNWRGSLEKNLKQKDAWKRVSGRNRSPSYRIHSVLCEPKGKRCSGTRTYRKVFLSDAGCKQMMKRCMESIKLEMEKQFPSVHMEANHLTNLPAEEQDFNWTPSTDAQTEKREHEGLWKEMEYALSILPSLEDKQELSRECSVRTSNGSTEDGEQQCQHKYILNEEIGIICQLCNFIHTEIRYVSLPFLRNDSWTRYRKQTEIELDWMEPYDFQSDSLSNVISSKELSVSEVSHDIWSLIPDLKAKLHFHQKRAFEFLWRNIAGSLKPEDVGFLPEKNGGCVISHSPGAGKTLVVISFLASYLRMFPGQRPLILCPKIALYVWCKEFEKWGISVPVYRIDPFDTYRKDGRRYQMRLALIDDLKLNQKAMHAMHCLEDIKKWHEQPSVLLMSYSSFLSLTREDSKLKHKRFVAAVLLKSPGILVLDEGHNPRSTGSKLRKQIMKVNTNLRILLSGTLFQNNFEEYFNTLCLARPRFIQDVICALNPRMLNNCSRKQNGKKVKNHREDISRKLFLQEIGNRIESRKEEERRKGFKKLMKMTGGFLDVYAGETLEKLPGLQVYTVILNSTGAQQIILSKLQQFIKHKRCPLELELLITVASMHPWLIKTVACASSYFSVDELESVDQYKCKFWEGSKIKFVIDLVHKSTTEGEKVLIFCHNIPPINFLLGMLGIMFGWRKGKEILVLQGDQDLFERSQVLDKFKEGSKDPAKVLLASTTASAEGISLTAASRVILLDSEWNHSKTKQAIGRAFRPGQQRVVYVYRLLASATCEEDKYRANEWKEWLSKMLFCGQYINHTSSRLVENIEDKVLREMVEEDQKKTFQMILKHD